MYEKKIKFSVNPSLIDKIPPEDKRAFSDGFQPIEDTLEELAAAISEEGFAFSFQFSGKRSAANFLAADFIAVDIDAGTTISETMDNPIVQNHCSMLYTTVSHTPEEHHFRMLFLLPRTITKAHELTSAARSLTRRLGGDPAATDAARIFYGSEGSAPQIFDKAITSDFLDELIKDGKRVPVRDSITNANHTANRSQHQFKLDLQIRTSQDTYVAISEIEQTTSIYCPFHPDRSPSALVGINKNGNPYIHCKSCQMTWWVKGSSPAPYNFYTFDQSVKSVRNQLVNEAARVETPFGRFIDLSGVPPENIQITNTDFLDLSQIKEGISLIKSPKGSGKTTFLSESIKRVIYPFATLEEFEEASDFEEEIPFVSGERILLIGHRQALIGDLCNRLGLNCYLDDGQCKPGEIAERQRRYGVCLDSLAKVRSQTYDMIVIDEVEQVLAHFMSETVGERRTDLFRLFSRQIQMAKKVVALDADLGWVSFATLTMLTRPTVKGGVTNPVATPIQIYLNEYQASSRSMLLYSRLGQLTQHLNSNVISGKRVFITSNSKTKIKMLEHAIQKMAKDAGIVVQMLAITSENSRQESIQKFIKNIKAEILNYQVILSSPSLGTGIDITFENEAQEIDCVYGIFENRINSHFEIDQQLARVRHPKEVHVWVSPQEFWFETEFDVVKTDYLHDHLMDVVGDGILANDTSHLSDVEQRFCVLAAMVTSLQRASKNQLKKNFIDYKQRQGWTINHVQNDDDLASQGNEILKIGKMIKNDLDVQQVVSAKTMNQYEFTLFRRRQDSNDGQIEPEEWYSYFRTRLELFYGQLVTSQLVEDDKKGKFASQIRMFESLVARVKMTADSSEDEFDLSVAPTLHNKLFKDRRVAVSLLHQLLSKTPSYSDGQFEPNVVFTRDDLAGFILESKKLDSLVQTHLDIVVRADLDEKPPSQLTMLLKTVGLSLNQPQKPTVLNGHKTYYYSVSGQDLKTIQDIASRREDPTKVGWNFVNQLYGFDYTPEEMDVIFEG